MLVRYINPSLIGSLERVAQSDILKRQVAGSENMECIFFTLFCYICLCIGIVFLFLYLQCMHRCTRRDSSLVERKSTNVYVLFWDVALSFSCSFVFVFTFYLFIMHPIFSLNLFFHSAHKSRYIVNLLRDQVSI